MGILLRVILTLFRLVTWPFRAIFRLFFRTSTSRAAQTARKAAGNLVATGHQESTEPDAIEQEEIDAPRPTRAGLFRALERPKLAERSASELTLDAAREFVGRAGRFYDEEFNLFPRGGLFYEEIELDEIGHALGADNPKSTDYRYVEWLGLFRKTLNDNSRLLMFVYAPALLVLTTLFAFVACRMWPGVSIVVNDQSSPDAAGLFYYPSFTLVGLAILLLIYQWPFKVISQRNLLGLDNYITSRFSRINQNFQVAKRFALNVERNKRMAQAEELKEEAGIWTVTYNWLAMRLYLCERLVRNQMYQVSRNTTLYRLAGILICFVILGGFYWASLSLPQIGIASDERIAMGLSGLVFIILSYGLILGGAANEAYKTLKDNEWFRFGAIELDQTIADHVGEDKLQIVTFRDRNRME